MNVERFEEEDVNDFLSELVSGNRLDNPALGITRFVIDNGYNSLSTRQRFVFEKAIQDFYYDECVRCGNEIPWCEMSGAEDNGGMCSWCAQLSRNDK